MSRSAVVLKFPTGEPVGPPPEPEEPGSRRRLSAWIGAGLALVLILTTGTGALLWRPDGGPSAPPEAPPLSGTLTVNAVTSFCRSHLNQIYTAEVRGVFYSGVAQEAVNGLLFENGPIPRQVVLGGSLYAGDPRYHRLVIMPWPGHETTISTGFWVRLKGVLGCTQPAGLTYLQAGPAQAP